MPRNASGVYTLPAGNPVVPGTTIDASWANSTLSDISNELTNSLSRTGAGGMLAPFRVDDGIVTGPGLAFVNETNTGYFRSGAGATAFSVLGVSTLQINTTSVTVPATRTLNAAGAALVGSTLGVTGAATFSSTLVVTGALTATGGVTGNITAASGTSTFNNVVINGSLDMVAGSAATITGLSTPVNASDAANKGYVDTQDALRLALTGGTLSGVLAMGSNKITGLGTPTNDADAATKAYVDSVAQGLDVKASVRAATTGNITLSGTQTIDGVAVIAGDRVLVKDQSTAANNGIYVAAAGAWSRSDDANNYDELVGAFTFVEDGTVNDNAGFVCTSPPGGTLGVTAITFDQFSGAGQVNAGTGMTKTGNTLNVNTASSARIVVGADEIDLAQTGVAVGTYKSVTVDLYGRVTAGTNPTTLAGYGISDAYTAAQTDSLLAGKLSLTGGTLSGALAMGTNRITGMGDPINAQDAATKNYIDTVFGSTATAAASAAAAAASASAASTSAGNASTSATASAASASAASTSASNAATSLFNFRAQYLGPSASNPTVDGNGNALTAGDLYYNTTANEIRVYTGTVWLAAYLPASGYLELSGGTMTGAINFAAAQTFDATKLSGVVAVANGGTGTTSTTFANLATNVTGTLPVANGGTGAATLTANNVLLGNGTSAVQAVAPGTAGNVLTSNGTTWQSTAPASGIPITLTGVSLATSLLSSIPSTLTLTAFDSYTTYTITSNNGTVSRTNETITFTPTSGGTVSITVNGRTVGPWTVVAAGENDYTIPGIYTWIAPAGVTSVSVVCIGGGAGGSTTSGGSGGGLGWKNNISVTPGNSYTVFAGAGGPPITGGQDSYFIGYGTVAAFGGAGSGGSYTGDGGGIGGNGGPFDGGGYVGGGGAGGYTGNGGNGTSGLSNTSFGVGNGGAGAGASGSSYSGGGGVGIYGQGVSGSTSAAGGSGGTSGTTSVAGVHGGGGGYNMTGGKGAVRIVWPGNFRSFPSTLVGP